MKIAHVLQTSLDSGQGGIATYLRNVIPRQFDAGHDVKVITNKRYKQFGDYSLPMGDFNFLNDKKFEALLHSLNANIRLSLMDFDVLHYHFPTSGFFSFFPALTGKKRVLTVHGRTELARELKPITKKVLNFVNHQVIPQMDAVTAVTPYLKDYLCSEFACESTYLAHGFSLTDSLPADIITEKFGLTKDSYYLALGRITTSKGFDTIIESYKMLPDKRKKLVIAGPPDGNYLSYLKSLIPHNLEDNILFTGNACDKELSELYTNAFLYISGIETPGLSLTILEAAGHKTPIATSKVPGANYPINNFTHRYETKNPSDLCELMMDLELNSEKRLQHVNDAFEYTIQNHSWEYIADNFLNIYENILK